MKKSLLKISSIILLADFGLTSGLYAKNGNPFTMADALAFSSPDKYVCLTFDDGPTAVTETVLNVLKKENVKATFFVIGKNIRTHTDTLKRIFAEGHVVGIHTHTHEYKKIFTSPEALKNDINCCLSAIKAVNENYKPKYYRFPGGSFGLSEGLKNVPFELGLKYVDWNASCRDCEIKPESCNDLTECAIQTSSGKNNVIILLHDAADKMMTALALPDIIQNFKQKGYTFVTVDKIK